MDHLSPLGIVEKSFLASGHSIENLGFAFSPMTGWEGKIPFRIDYSHPQASLKTLA